MKPVSFIVTISNEDSPDLTETQTKLLEGVVEKWLGEHGRDYPQSLVADNYLPDDEDSVALNELWNNGWDTEVRPE